MDRQNRQNPMGDQDKRYKLLNQKPFESPYTPPTIPVPQESIPENAPDFSMFYSSPVMERSPYGGAPSSLYVTTPQLYSEYLQ